MGWAALWFLGMVLGCDAGTSEFNGPQAEGGQGKPQDVTDTDCGDRDEHVLALSDEFSSGGTIADFLAPLLDGPLAYEPAWADGVERELVVTAGLVGDTVVATTYSECPERDRVEATVAVTLVTDDGLFDEAWTTNLRRNSPGGRMDLSVDIFVDELGGSFDVADWAEGAESVILWMGVGAAQEADDGGYLQARMSREDEYGAHQRVGLCGWGTSEDSYQPVDTIDTGI